MNKDDIKNIVIAVVSVLVVLAVVLAIAGALFLYGESDIALLFAIIGVPVIIACCFLCALCALALYALCGFFSKTHFKR